ncbi:bifunctional diguanylate cyclase/phosphodiesterase [Sphingomonas montanisoli]|uniref:Bifunctional diguanylate cyclase/phosphodiesterase n=1 Tax=Sphingomonas montanisoli TaxID=2606412 RepID=A0A5D9C8Q7_9SPHN|nr:bifunctional diguanylate cyclase/phosphodiesterase [Sphingomonas montanisoli]
MRATRPQIADLPVAPEAAAPAGNFPVPPALQQLLNTPRAAERQEFLDALPVAVAIVAEVDGNPRIMARNAAFLRLSDMRLAASELAKADLCSGLALPLNAALRAFFAADDEDRAIDMQETTGIGGRHFAVRMVRLRTGESASPRCVLSLIDCTAQIESERSLRKEMLRDSLTGLPNRSAFAERVDKAIDAFGETGDGFAVLVVDLTRFSRVNEGVGSLAGDELIITVARRLVSTLRAGDVLARIVGDEFAVLMELGSAADALRAARRMQAALATPIRLGDLEIKIDCAVGCALMSSGIDLAEEVIRNAQFAVKRAKTSGQAEIYQTGDSAAARERFSMETELRRAIEQDQLTLAYQPLIDLTSGEVTGFEALARWVHAEKGIIPPSEFIPVAEESGLIVELGRWAMRAAARTLAAWDRRAGYVLPIYMSVNVSAVQFQRDDVAAAVAAALVESRIAGERFKLELTESCIVADPQGINRVLGAIHDLGVGIAMDDFGTGYSSLAYLQRLPIDVLKIDRSFIAPMLEDKDSVAIVRAVLGLANALGMVTTAEGVETAALAETLIALGCDVAQGYHFAKALPADEAYLYLAERNAFASSSDVI